MILISLSIKAAKLAILTLLEPFFHSMKKNACPQKVMREKGSLSVSVSEKS